MQSENETKYVTRRSLRLALGIFASLLSMSVLAEESVGWYGGVSLGRSKFGASQTGIDNALASGGIGGLNSSFDRQDTAYKARLGYDFSNGLAVEAGYADFGKAIYGGNFSSPVAGNLSGDVKASGFNVDLLGNLPVARDLAVFGKVGLMFSDTAADAAASGTSVSLSDKSSRALPGVGLGLNYTLTKSLGLRAEWEKYYRLGSDVTGRGDIDQLSVGVNLKFR
jgi:OOP family OmpA-OmpF porin